MSDGLREVLFERRKVVLIRLLTLVESPPQSSQVVNFNSWSRQKEIVCMVRCMSKREVSISVSILRPWLGPQHVSRSPFY
jgi:hypothetical protein